MLIVYNSMLVKLFLLPFMLLFVMGQLELEKFSLVSIALELIQTFKKDAQRIAAAIIDL